MRNVTLTELLILKQKMERDIRDAIIERLQVFEAETGLTPEALSVDFHEVTAIGDERRRYIPGEVTTTIQL